MKETVAIELSYLNSNLQLLKEQLAELNSSMELYQMKAKEEVLMPMIPLGLKETKEIDMKVHRIYKVMCYIYTLHFLVRYLTIYLVKRYCMFFKKFL